MSASLTYILVRGLILVILGFRFVNSEIVWKPETLFNSPENWKDNIEPCHTDTIVFPKDFDSVLDVPNLFQFGGVVLPRTGALVFPRTGNLELTSPGATSDKPCKSKNSLAYFKKPEKKYWFDPNNWERTGLLKHENFSPHTSALPCAGEHIKIRRDGALSIDLQDISRLEITSIEFHGSNMTHDQMKRFLKTQEGQMIFKSAGSTDIRYTPKVYCNCHNPIYQTDYHEKLCRVVKLRAGRTKCSSPVWPIGHCFGICGTLAIFRYEHCDESIVSRVKQTLSDAITNEKLDGKLSFSARVMDNLMENVLQIVIKEEKGGEQLSKKFFDSYFEANQNVLGKYKSSKIESSQESFSAAIGSGWLLVLLTLLFVVVFFGVVYNHYIGNGFLPTLYALVGRPFNSPFIFARFENNPVEVETQGKVVVNVAYDTESERQAGDEQRESEECTATGFNNPMFRDDKVDEIGTEMSVSSFDAGMTQVSLEPPSNTD